MYKYILLVFTFSCFYVKQLTGQCLDHDALRNRLILLRDSKMLTPHDELVELRNYESRLYKCSNKNDSTHVFLFQRIAKLFSDQGDYIRAIEYNKRSVDILTENLHKPSTKPSQLISTYYTLADLYGKLNKVTEKFRYFDSCIDVAQRMKIVDIRSLYPLLQKVERLFTIGDYDLCIRYASMGESLSRRYVPEDDTKQFGDSSDYANYFLSPKVNALISLERYDEAEMLLLKKLGEWKKAWPSRFIGTLHEQLATVQMAKKNFNAGIHNLKQAFAYNSKAGETVSCKVNMDNLGYFTYQVYKDHRLALSYFKKALRYGENTARDSVNSVNVYNHIAGLYVDRGQFDSAQYYFQCAFDQIKKGTNESEVLDNPLNVFVQRQQIKYVMELFMDKGEAFFKEYKATGSTQALESAIRIYHLTDLLIERTKASQSEIKSKLFWRKHTHRFYERAITASVSAKQVNDAFYFFERSRAILLYDQLSEQSWVGENDILKQNQLAVKLDQMQEQLARYNPLSHQHAALLDRWYVLKQEHLKLQQRIKVKNPLYYQNYLDTTFTTLRDVRRYVLRDHQALVELFVGNDAVYNMVVTPDTTFFNIINKPAYDSTLNLCINYVSDPGLQNRDFNSFAQSSSYLYNLLFKNIPVPAGRVIVSPDGRYFPFEALITSFTGRKPVYFLDDHAVSYTYSARYLMNNFVNSSKPGTKNFLGIAPVEFPEEFQLSPLAGSNVSIEKLEGYFSRSDNLLEERATKQGFRDRFGKYKIIQIYTHSSDSSSEGEPVIYFADKPLYLSEITNQKQPSTELVVLSACETGKGKFYQGEGIFSFNRAFAAIGIPSCINNLWSVDNESTYELTELFFSHLSKGLTIDRALQQAKLEFIRTTPDRGRLPYYWAAAILAGKTNPVQLNSPLQWTWIVLISITGLIGAWFVARNIPRFTSVNKPRIKNYPA